MNTETLLDLKDEKLFDLCMIDRFCRGNRDLIKKMIGVFTGEIPSAVEEIRLAYEKSDFVTIKKTAHRIKPVLSIYAIIKIEKDIRQIEKLAEEGMKTAELEMKIQKIDAVISQVTRKMKQDYL